MISKATKEDKEKEQKKKEQPDVKNKEKEAQFQKLEEYVNESGLSLAFNIIFAELISKQILPENYFTYTSMRLTQIGKEIEGLKTKEAIYVDDDKEQEQNIQGQNDEQEQVELPAPEEENKDKIFMTSPQKQEKPQVSSNVKKKK